MINSSLKICTWNVRGFHSPIKREKIICYLRKEKIDIALLQETHLDNIEHMKLQQGGFGQVFFSSFSSKSRGVEILISKNLPFKLEISANDKYGRYVMIKGSVQGHGISLMNVYCPPAHPTDFLTKIFLEFSAMNSENSIVGGDFNCILNPIMDRFPQKISPLSPQAKSLNAVCRDLGFVDVWRFFHPLSKEFTYFSAPHGCHTRIDYLFIPHWTSYPIVVLGK